MDPDPTTDPTPFFSDFKDAKKNYFFHIFFLTYPLAHYMQSQKFNFLLKFCVKILFCKHYFSPEPDSELDPDPYGTSVKFKWGRLVWS